MFNQKLLVCDWWHNFRCEETREFYTRNQEIFEEMSEKSGSSGSAPAQASSQRSLSGTRRSIERKEEAISDDNEGERNLPNSSRVYFDEDIKEDREENNQEESAMKSPSSATEQVKRRSGPSSSLKDSRTKRKSKKLNSVPDERRKTISEGDDNTEYYFNDDNDTKSLSKSGDLEEDL